MTDLRTADLPPAAKRVAEAASDLNLDIEVIEMASSTRTAEEAAAACGCDVGQIVKSLVFRGIETDAPYLVLASGRNRVDEAKASAALGEPIERPDANYVRDTTGFAIGGIPPFGHPVPMRVLMDPDLLTFPAVWAAAGTPRCVFKVDPAELRAAIAADVAPLT